MCNDSFDYNVAAGSTKPLKTVCGECNYKSGHNLVKPTEVKNPNGSVTYVYGDVTKQATPSITFILKGRDWPSRDLKRRS